ncbi:helix-turn-helix transcriptional regulator, partial [Mycobacterium tuberculosis]|nr:helix-turn-helix transcriptional regulator [Mycobacterium tuberculosis]
MQPKWSRRKEARPLEIVDAAVDVFLENGVAAAKLSDIAKRARVAKGT